MNMLKCYETLSDLYLINTYVNFNLEHVFEIDF